LPEVTFKYKETEGIFLTKVNRPLIDIDAYSKSRGRWFQLPEILADSGADISILPRYMGEILVEDFTTGKKGDIRGIVPHSKLIIFVHKLQFRIDGKEFNLPVGIADCDDVPPILGRVDGLDIFRCVFDKGKKTIIQWED